MNTFKLIGIVHDIDIEINIPYEDAAEIGPIVLAYKAAGFQAKPRFNARDNTPFEPFKGNIEKIEDTETKNGKPMFIAHVRPITGEGEEKKPLVAVKYMPPKSSYRVGDPVKVTKNDKGWLELSEDDNMPF